MATGDKGGLAERRAFLQRAIAQTGLMRPGSLVERFRKCGKPRCHCAAEGAAGHGPQWLLTRPVEGKTVSRVIPAGRVAQAQAQLAAHKRFREQVHELVEVNVALCDAALATESPAQAEAQKGGSRVRSLRRVKRRSRPS